MSYNQSNNPLSLCLSFLHVKGFLKSFWEDFPNFIYLKAGLNQYISSIIATGKRHGDFRSSLFNVHIILFICHSSPHPFQKLISYNLARSISKYCIFIITFLLWLEEKLYVEVGIYIHDAWWHLKFSYVQILVSELFRGMSLEKSLVYVQKSIN